jgi:hypothetical protein
MGFKQLADTSEAVAFPKADALAPMHSPRIDFIRKPANIFPRAGKWTLHLSLNL